MKRKENTGMKKYSAAMNMMMRMYMHCCCMCKDSCAPIFDMFSISGKPQPAA